MRFGDGIGSSIGAGGNLNQPQYFDASNTICTSSGCKLTFGGLPFSYALGVNGSGSGTWNTNGLILTGGQVYTAAPVIPSATPVFGSVVSTATNTIFTPVASLRDVTTVDISRYNEGVGAVTVSASIPAGTIGLTGSNFTISNTYTLGAQARFLKTESQITAGSTALDNVRMWAVIPDDFFGATDFTIKTKGNFSNTGFTQITSQTDIANAVQVSDGPTSTATALIFSHSSGVNSLIGSISGGLGSVFDMVGVDPKTSLIQKNASLDGYGLFATRNNLAANTSTGVVTFFGVAPNASFTALKDQLIAAADISATKPTVPPADLNNLLAGIKPPSQTALPPPLAPAPPPVQGSNLADPNKPPPQNSALDIDKPLPPPSSTQPAAPAPAPAAPVNAPPPSVGSASAPPVNTAPKPPAPAPVSAPVTPVATAVTPVAPPPPSPVGDVKPPTPKDAADTGDKTLAAAAPPPPPSAASQTKRSNTPTSTVKVGSVIVETVAQVNVPAVAGEQRFSLSGNSAAW